eukprot:49425-Amphidinium_carterae.1
MSSWQPGAAAALATCINGKITDLTGPSKAAFSLHDSRHHAITHASGVSFVTRAAQSRFTAGQAAHTAVVTDFCVD